MANSSLFAQPVKYKTGCVVHVKRGPHLPDSTRYFRYDADAASHAREAAALFGCTTRNGGLHEDRQGGVYTVHAGAYFAGIRLDYGTYTGTVHMGRLDHRPEVQPEWNAPVRRSHPSWV